MPALYFASAPRAIGAHLWRIVVANSRHGGRRFLYQFTPVDELPIWQDMQAWPHFDRSAPRMGLPWALALLYEANAVAVADAMLDRDEFARLMA